jgi:hypothetical protein
MSREKGIGNMISNVDEGRNSKETGKEEKNGESQKGKLKIDRKEGQGIMVWRTREEEIKKETNEIGKRTKNKSENK